jgi:hypothetical protein
MALLFLIKGKNGPKDRVVISRFPTANAIHVDESSPKLTVEFLERVFMKSKSSYKAVLYEDAPPYANLWDGKAVDRQINDPSGQTSNYWIADFLLSDFLSSPVASSRRLAVAIKEAIKSATTSVQHELASAARLASGLSGKRTSIRDFIKNFSLSKDAEAAILSQIKNKSSIVEVFAFDANEFSRHVAYKMLVLNNEVTIIAPNDQFDKLIKQKVTRKGGKERIFATKGTVINERLKTNP